jgi:hypothetical protein
MWLGNWKRLPLFKTTHHNHTQPIHSETNWLTSARSDRTDISIVTPAEVQAIRTRQTHRIPPTKVPERSKACAVMAAAGLSRGNWSEFSQAAMPKISEMAWIASNDEHYYDMNKQHAYP